MRSRILELPLGNILIIEPELKVHSLVFMIYLTVRARLGLAYPRHTMIYSMVKYSIDDILCDAFALTAKANRFYLHMSAITKTKLFYMYEYLAMKEALSNTNYYLLLLLHVHVLI